MNLHAMAAAQQMATLGLFECCYVKGTRATYALHDSKKGDNFNDVIWFRTVDILSGEIIDENSDPMFWGDGLCALRWHIEQSFSVERIRGDGVSLLYQLLVDIKGGSEPLHSHIVFGQAVHFQDVIELWVRNEQSKIITVVTNRGYSQYDPETDQEIERMEIVAFAKAA